MENERKAYVAGVMDCDGSFMIVGRKDGKRYEPVVAVAQVTPQIPSWMLTNFGGNLQHVELEPPRRNRYMWRGSGSVALEVCRACLDYLLIKQEQAATLLELGNLADPRLKSYAFWYSREHPNWRNERLITTAEAQAIIGYEHDRSVKQAIRTGVLLALPGTPGKYVGRIPLGMAQWLHEIRQETSTGRLPTVPPPLVSERRRLWQKVKALNKTGC